MQQRHEPAIDLHRPGDVAVLHRLDQGHRLLGEGVGQARDPALGAQDQPLQRHVVQADHDGIAVAQFVEDVGDAPRIRGAFLQGHDVRHVRQPLQVVVVERLPIHQRIVVEHVGQAAGRRHGAEVGLQLRLRRHIDHGRQHHQGVDAEVFGVLGVAFGPGRGQFADPGDDRHAAVGDLDGRLEDGALLFRLQRVVLADRAHDDDAVDAVIDQAVQHRLGGVQINRQPLVELGGGRRDHPGPVQLRPSHKPLLLKQIYFRIRYLIVYDVKRIATYPAL
ncbi:hypothetical protein D3C80_1352540 [compost metagenome]